MMGIPIISGTAMTDTIPLSLPERLRQCAELYAQTPDGSLPRLGKRAINDGAFFDRMGERGPTTATLEKFAQFLADPANWPEGAVPEEARAFAHVCGVSADAAVPSAGNAGEGSPKLGRAAA